MKDARTYYVVEFRLDSRTHYCAWYGDEVDGLVLSPEGKIAACGSKEELQCVMEARGAGLALKAPTFYDFDRLAAWLAGSAPAPSDCNFMLDAWNMLVDVAVSLGLTIEEPDGANAIYDKLFWGSNIPAMTPEGQHFDPTWVEEEVAVLAEVMKTGLSVLRTVLPRDA